MGLGDLGICQTPGCDQGATVGWMEANWCHPHLERFFEDMLEGLKRSRPSEYKRNLAEVMFPRLLAIAKAADAIKGHCCERCDAVDIRLAIHDLNGAHPDWREWTP